MELKVFGAEWKVAVKGLRIAGAGVKVFGVKDFINSENSIQIISESVIDQRRYERNNYIGILGSRNDVQWYTYEQ